MKMLALGLTAALIGGAGLTAQPAAAGVYFEFNDHGPRHVYGPPRTVYRQRTVVYDAPPPYVYRPRPVYYDAPPRQVCTVRITRVWGPFGPENRRIETCRRGW